MNTLFTKNTSIYADLYGLQSPSKFIAKMLIKGL